MAQATPLETVSAQERDAERKLAKLKGSALRISREVYEMQALTAGLPMGIVIEANNVQECLDLLRHRLHEETLLRVVGKRDGFTEGKLRKPLSRERVRP